MTANFTMGNWELLIANMLGLKVCIPFPLIPMDFHTVQYFQITAYKSIQGIL